jgi:hypothetical protein
MEIINTDFWTRHPSRVAKDLVGKTVVIYSSLGWITPAGVLTEVDAYENPSVARDEHVFSQKPGTLGVFTSRRGPIPVITAHSSSARGLITLRNLVAGTENYGPKGICELLGMQQRDGKLVGHESGLYIGDSGIDFKEEGLYVADDMPAGGPENRVAYFSLRKK